jgi:hypothetical protein
MALQSANIPEIITLEQWLGMNRQSARTGVNDQECWWLENLFPVGPAQLRSGWGHSGAIYTAPGGTTINRIFFANITGANPSGFMFLSNGHVQRVDLNTHAVVDLGAIWGPVTAPYYADLKLWLPNFYGNVAGQVGGVVLGSPQGLYAVDGNDTVTGPGAAPPLWLTNGQTHDGNNNPLVMPSGLPGIYALEVYKDRLWVMGRTVISFSAPSNGANFASVDGGGSFPPYAGDQLTLSFTDLQATSGFLYIFADSATNQITDLSLQGASSPIGPLYTTQFQNSNVDPQVGQAFFRSVGAWEQTFALFNLAGIWLMAGAQSAWISEKITNLLLTLNPTPFSPTQCPAHIFGKKWMLFNAQLTDTDGVSRPLLLCWSGPQLNQWVVASQNLNLTHIGSYEQNSLITPYGTDGTSLYQLFAQPDPNLPKRIQTKAYTGNNFLTIKDWKRAYVEYSDNRNGPEGVFLVGTMDTLGGGIPNGSEQVSYSLLPRGNDTVPSPTIGKGIAASLDLKSLSPDFTIARISFTFDERQLYGA